MVKSELSVVKCVCPEPVLHGWGSLSSNADTQSEFGPLVPPKTSDLYIMGTGLYMVSVIRNVLC